MAALGDEAQLARQIKHFRKDFRREHGRDPSRKDMARQPEIAAVYKAWLACKGVDETGNDSQSQASTSTLKVVRDNGSTAKSNGKARDTSSHKQEQAPMQRQKRSLFAEDMPAPPSTPGRKKPNQQRQSFVSTPKRTPTRNAEMVATIEDSGGSIIDVPMTPIQKKKRRARMDSAASPSSNAKRQPSLLQPGPSQGDARFRELDASERQAGLEYDDATSPSKLRALIASFTATRSRLTPTKMKAAASRAARFAEDEHGSDESASSSETEAAVAQDASLESRLRASRLSYTPRTKARKRLRGEVIVTPGKTPVRPAAEASSSALDEATTPSKPRVAKRHNDTQPPVAKRQRGTGSLKSFGFTAARGDGEDSQGSIRLGALPSASTRDMGQASQSIIEDEAFDDMDDEEDDDDDDMIGPSPSVRKIVDMSSTVFEPLLGAKHAADEDVELAPASAEKAGKSMAEDDKNDEAESSDNELNFVRAYEPYSQSSSRRPRRAGMEGDDDDDIMPALPFAASHEMQEAVHAGIVDDNSDTEEDPSPALFGGLTLASPQCRRARQAQRMRAAQKVRALLALDENALQAAQDEVEQSALTSNASDLSKQANALAATERARTTAKMLSAPKKRGVHAGRAKAALAAEAAEQSLTPETDQSTTLAFPTSKPKLIMRRGREDDYDSDEDAEAGGDMSLLLSDDEEVAEFGKTGKSHTRADASDDDWASDVGSDEYGLGDGLMDEYDVI